MRWRKKRGATTEADEDWELPDLPAIDDRQLRRAIRRGVLRTAAVGAVYLVVGAITLNLAVQLVLAPLGRQDQLHRLVTAWQVAHPEFIADERGVGPSWFGRYQTLDARLFGDSSDPAPVRVRLSTNLLGHLAGPTPLPQSAAEDALRLVGTTHDGQLKRRELESLSRLPVATSVSAVVEFARPLTGDSLDAWLAETGQLPAGHSGVLLMTAAEQRIKFRNGTLEAPVYGWLPSRYFHGDGNSTYLSTFRQWVSELHNSDASNLHKVGVDLDRLRAAARAGLVHGMIVTGQTPAQLTKLLQTPEVSAVYTYNIEFRNIP